jgi:tetratricopeptide (TPR) repeat protein
VAGALLVGVNVANDVIPDQCPVGLFDVEVKNARPLVIDPDDGVIMLGHLDIPVSHPRAMLYRRSAKNDPGRRLPRPATALVVILVNVIIPQTAFGETMSPPPRLQRARLKKASRRPSGTSTRQGAAVAAALWGALENFGNIVRIIFLNVVGICVAAIVLIVFWRAITTPSVKISEISIPKSLSDQGYTSSQAADILKENMLEVIREAKSEKRSEAVMTKFEIKDIEIPGVSLSLDNIEDTLRHFISLAPFWEISGAIVPKKDQKDKYVIHLRIWDGRDNRTFDGDSDDGMSFIELMRAGSRAVIGEIDPYLLAAFYRFTNINKAEEIAEAVLNKYPSNRTDAFWAHIALGNIYGQKNSDSRALFEHQQAVLINYKQPIGHTSLCMDLFLLNRDQEAIEECQRAINIDPGYAPAYVSLAQIEKFSGDLKSAATHLDYAIYFNDSLASAHFGKGDILAQRGDWPDAEVELRKYTLLEPKDDAGHQFLGQVLENEGKLEDAVEEYMFCIKEKPDNMDAHERLGAVYIKQGYEDDYLREVGVIKKLKE